MATEDDEIVLDPEEEKRLEEEAEREWQRQLEEHMQQQKEFEAADAQMIGYGGEGPLSSPVLESGEGQLINETGETMNGDENADEDSDEEAERLWQMMQQKFQAENDEMQQLELLRQQNEQRLVAEGIVLEGQEGDEDDLHAWDGGNLIDYKNLRFYSEEPVAGGSFGKIFKADYLGLDVAVKQFLSDGSEEEDQKYIDREIATLRNIRHPNVVSFMGICKHNADLFLITEWIPNGDLTRELMKKDKQISWRQRVGWAKDTAVAMTYLHAHNIIHRDLKTENLLLTDNYRIKVCDLGFARSSTKKLVRKLSIAGTGLYMAPEVMLGDMYDEKCDVFSYGVVILELITRQSPPKRSVASMFVFDLNVVSASIPPDCPPKFAELMFNCIKQAPADRPSFQEILPTLNQLLEELPMQEEEKANEEQQQRKLEEDEKRMFELKQELMRKETELKQKENIKKQLRKKRAKKKEEAAAEHQSEGEGKKKPSKLVRKAAKASDKKKRENLIQKEVEKRLAEERLRIRQEMERQLAEARAAYMSGGGAGANVYSSAPALDSVVRREEKDEKSKEKNKGTDKRGKRASMVVYLPSQSEKISLREGNKREREEKEKERKKAVRRMQAERKVLRDKKKQKKHEEKKKKKLQRERDKEIAKEKKQQSGGDISSDDVSERKSSTEEEEEQEQEQAAHSTSPRKSIDVAGEVQETEEERAEETHEQGKTNGSPKSPKTGSNPSDHGNSNNNHAATDNDKKSELSVDERRKKRAKEAKDMMTRSWGPSRKARLAAVSHENPSKEKPSGLSSGTLRVSKKMKGGLKKIFKKSEDASDNEDEDATAKQKKRRSKLTRSTSTGELEKSSPVTGRRRGSAPQENTIARSPRESDEDELYG